MMDALKKFLQEQELITIATYATNPWIINVFYGIDEDTNIYFIMPENTQTAENIKEQNTVAFATAAYSTHTNRKGIQGRGVIHKASTREEIQRGVQIHNTRFPVFKERINEQYVKEGNTAVWVLRPTQIQFWNDELYPEKTKKFTFT